MARLIASTELKDRLSSQDVVLVDVGEPETFEEAHVPGAINIPLGELRNVALEHKASFLRKDYIIVYGQQADISLSDEAAELLEGLGFERVGNFFGGRAAWFNAGYNLARGTDSVEEEGEENRVN